MKHQCPSCGKQFDFEKNGWICPCCGSVVLHSTEQMVYAKEQQAQQQKQQQQKQIARTFGSTLWQSVRSKFLLLFLLLAVLCVILFGGAILIQERTLAQLRQSSSVELTEQTRNCGDTISIAPYVVQIAEATWAEDFTGFPEEVKPPAGGRYLIVSFVCTGDTASQKDVYPDDVMWACLDTGDGYLLPQHAMNLNGSDEVQSELYNLGMGYQLDTHDSFLAFLVDEKVQADQLALRIYAGEPAAKVSMSENNAQNCYVIPLEVTP